MKRRTFVQGLLAAPLLLALIVGCKKPEKQGQEERCKNCGMKIDPKSAWTARLIGLDGKVVPFDTPPLRPDVMAERQDAGEGLHVQEYYDRVWRDAVEVRLVIGGDVLGPMGPDLVPVDTPRAAKFVQDHGADRAIPVEQVTMDVLNNIK